MDPYKILNVGKNSSDTEIKKAFRKLAAQHHPDKGGNEEKFKELNEAYSKISTAQKRQEHEYSQHAGDFPDFGGNPFADFGFGDLFSQMFNTGRPQHKKNKLKEQTDDEITFKLKLSLSQIKKGVSQQIQFNRNKKCMSCKGRGGNNKIICHSCQGQGVVVIRKGMIIQQIPCSTCNQKGYVFEQTCNRCNGHGMVKVRETINLRVDSY